MRPVAKYGVVLTLLALGVPPVMSGVLVLHELGHSGEEKHDHLATVLHGHDHGIDAAEHEHPVLKSPGPIVPSDRAAAQRAGLGLHKASETSLRPLEPAVGRIVPRQSADLCVWRL